MVFDQGDRISQPIAAADVADICLRALHEPESRNKTFDVCYEYEVGPTQHHTTRACARYACARSGTCRQGPASGVHASREKPRPSPCTSWTLRRCRAQSRMKRLAAHARSARSVLDARHTHLSWLCVQADETNAMYELVAHVPDKKNNYLRAAVASLAKNT